MVRTMGLFVKVARRASECNPGNTRPWLLTGLASNLLGTTESVLFRKEPKFSKKLRDEQLQSLFQSALIRVSQKLFDKFRLQVRPTDHKKLIFTLQGGR